MVSKSSKWGCFPSKWPKGLINGGYTNYLLAGLILQVTGAPSAVANQNPSWCNPTEYCLVICLGCSFFIFSKRKSWLEKIPLRKGGSITPLRIMTRFDGHCPIAWRIEHLKKKNIWGSKLVVREPGQICNIGFRSSWACISVMWKRVSKATVTWVPTQAHPEPQTFNRRPSEGFRHVWGPKIARKLFKGPPLGVRPLTLPFGGWFLGKVAHLQSWKTLKAPYVVKFWIIEPQGWRWKLYKSLKTNHRMVFFITWKWMSTWALLFSNFQGPGVWVAHHLGPRL